jgi:hypothetical protein
MTRKVLAKHRYTVNSPPTTIFLLTHLSRASSLYSWQANSYAGLTDIKDWNVPYKQVAITNLVLESLQHIAQDTTNQQEWNTIKGQALFLRSHAFYQLAQVFAAAYDPVHASDQEGIVLSLTTDLHTVYRRASLKDSYRQITEDLLSAKNLLPPSVGDSNRAHPSRGAVCALLARTFLTMADYPTAGRWADSALQYAPPLLDYNVLNTNDRFPFANARDEVIYPCALIEGGVLVSGKKVMAIDTGLYNSYEDTDLRKKLFFKNFLLNIPGFKGSYTGGAFCFSGFASDELLLIKAECHAQTGDTGTSLAVLQQLLMKRYLKGQSPVSTNATRLQALALVERERRKELIFRGLRWSDLKRYNMAGAQLTLSRTLGGQAYMLPPNHHRYLLPIPQNAINGSAITQNPRD